jgi:putative ABC transport system permease protein
MISKYIHNFVVANEAMMQNKLRAGLTSLGIICGVASVIAMLAIGKGAEQEILEKMKLLGTNNIIIKPLTAEEQKKKQEESGDESQNTENQQDVTKKKKRFSPGLTLKDSDVILKFVPGVSNVSPEIILNSTAISEGYKFEVKLVGVGKSYLELGDLELIEGNLFSALNMVNSDLVCIIGSAVKTRLFPMTGAIGRKLKCKSQWLTVIGVLKNKSISKDNIKNLGIRDYNGDVYIPVNTMLLRFENRARASGNGNVVYFSGGSVLLETGGEQVNYNQLDKLTVSVENSAEIRPIADIISRMLTRRHNNEADFEVIVPEQLLEQEQKTKNIFNVVLGAIASISLVVGGIGIMNIMLASVLERTKEIGIRRAIGAKSIDILLQFISEAIAISLTGGILGIILGITISLVIEKATGIQTIVSAFSVFISFFVSIAVGLIFGIMPARKAAMQDPIVSLRYE